MMEKFCIHRAGEWAMVLGEYLPFVLNMGSQDSSCVFFSSKVDSCYISNHHHNNSWINKVSNSPGPVTRTATRSYIIRHSKQSLHRIVLDTLQVELLSSSRYAQQTVRGFSFSNHCPPFKICQMTQSTSIANSSTDFSTVQKVEETL